jgi:TPR repeat protein
MGAFAFEIDSVNRGASIQLPILARLGRLVRPAGALASALMLMGAASALALDSSQQADGKKIPLKSFSSAEQALRAGLDDLQAGDAQSSVEALTYAAEGGQPLAEWKLGSMYARGEGVPHDDLKAYQYFEQIIDNYNEDDPSRRDISAVSKAFVAVGVYCLNGIPNTAIKPDPERALEMFQFAATNFGDPDAQYNLARMYMDGSAGLAKNNMRAARWLMLAAEKHHRPAQALLGHLLFSGDGVPRQRARGLMWLTIAKSAAKSQGDEWIKDLFVKDYAAASDDDRQAAAMFISDRDAGHNYDPPPGNLLARGFAILPPFMRMFDARPAAPTDFAGPDSPVAAAPPQP